jgi:hypothetical protein
MRRFLLLVHDLPTSEQMPSLFLAPVNWPEYKYLSPSITAVSMKLVPLMARLYGVEPSFPLAVGQLMLTV